MKTIICQSCGMPLTVTSRGTEYDLKPATEYCKYCYQEGHYTNPDLPLEEQIKRLATMAVVNMLSSPEEALRMAEQTLPRLKRWQTS